MTTSLAMLGFEWPQSVAGSLPGLAAPGTDVCSKQTYSTPELVFLGRAVDLILARIECASVQAAKRIRRLIDESAGSLTFSPTKECQKVQIDLSLVSKQFKKLFRVTMRSY